MAGNYANDRFGHACRTMPGAGRDFKKPRRYLTGDFKRDMRELRILGTIRNAQTRKDVDVDETPQFIAYLTLGLQNLSEIVGKNTDLSGMKSADAVAKELEESDRLQELASFLWMFRADEPQRDYRRTEHLKQGYADLAKAIALKLWELRNMFVHPSEPGIAKALVADRDFYRFVEGELYGEARGQAMGPGRKTEKLFKLKLMVPHNDAATQYEFTRRGLIFLICLALYRHDASEFIQQFADMRLPPRKWEMEDEDAPSYTEADLVQMRKKGGSVKAIIDAFTFYSMRASRTDIDVANADYLNFANILTYLNKVPMASYDYLALDDEAKGLGEKGAASVESEENRRFKYLLHPRRKDRFLTLALAYLEDFNELPCLKFKRLDITPRPDRKRYRFGKIPKGKPNEFGEEISDANGMDRHYAIVNGVAQFEFIPKQHYGAIKISRLRGGIGEGELMRLLLVMHDKSVWRTEPNRALEDYLTAYHRILERMLNARMADEISLDDAQYRADFKAVSGKDDAALDKSVFVEAMKPFFPQNLTRHFTGAELKPTTRQLQSALAARFTAMAGRARDFLVKLDNLTEWRALDAEARKKKVPLCPVGELRYPPRTFKMNDADLTKMVLRYINLFLQKDEKYRQLPRGLRHRGVKDFEFQLLHADIGGFGTNPGGLWRTLEKRESLNRSGGALELLKDREAGLFREETRRCRGKFDRNGRPLRPAHTLTMLATAAAELYAEACEELRGCWCGEIPSEDAELLPYVCPAYGVRVGMPLDREALVKSILGIDLSAWSRSFDYEHGKPFENRRLEDADDLIAAQIPVPNALAIRCVAQDPDFAFNRAFRAFEPWEKGKMALRRYYDVTPLIDYVKTHKKDVATVDPAAPGVETRGGRDAVEGTYGKQPPALREFLKTEVNKAILAIQLAERQDKVLLACAKEYWERYMAVEVTANENAKEKNLQAKVKNIHLSDVGSIADFFTTEIEDEVSGVKIRMMPNDFARPAYGVVTRHVGELVKRTKPIAGTDGVYAFYDLWLALKDLQRKESTVRCQLLSSALRFHALCTLPKDKMLTDEEVVALWNKALRGISPMPITAEEIGLLTELRNRLCHPPRSGSALLGLDFERAKSVLRRYGCLIRA